MALIVKNGIKGIEKEKNSVHKIVECTYTVFSDDDGNKYFQLDTYGSQDRKIKNKISQSIQLNKHSAKILYDIIAKEYGY